MVEENAVGCENSVGVAVVLHDVIRVNLCGRVGASGLKQRFFALRRRRGAEHFTRRRLVEFCFDAGLADGFQNSQRAQTGDVSGVLGHVEAHADVALRAQMIDFVRTDGGKQVHDLTGNGEIPEVQKQLRIRVMKIPVQMIDAVRVERAGAADQPVNLVTLAQQKLGQVRSVLSGDAGD